MCALVDPNFTFGGTDYKIVVQLTNVYLQCAYMKGNEQVSEHCFMVYNAAVSNGFHNTRVNVNAFGYNNVFHISFGSKHTQMLLISCVDISITAIRLSNRTAGI